MHKNVEVLIGRLATYPALRKRFTDDPRGVLTTLAERGLELTSVEIDALAALEPNALDVFAASLDPRLCRVTETPHTREAS